jgi:hypothetical protein
MTPFQRAQHGNQVRAHIHSLPERERGERIRQAIREGDRIYLDAVFERQAWLVGLRSREFNRLKQEAGYVD